MNNTFFNKDIFPQNSYNQSSGQAAPTYSNALSFDVSYMEDIFKLNAGKKVLVNMTFPNSNDFRDCKFNGIIEKSGKDYIILSEPNTGNWQLLLVKYIDFITFDENINYNSELYSNN